MSLEHWLQSAWLEGHEPTMLEILKLLRVADREVSDAQVEGLSLDGRFEHAYAAALQACMIALHASGFRVAKGKGAHKTAIGSLRFTLGEGWSDDSDILERCSRLRGQAVYDHVGVATEETLEELLDLAQRLRTAVVAWLKQNHPHLIPPNQE